MDLYPALIRMLILVGGFAAGWLFASEAVWKPRYADLRRGHEAAVAFYREQEDRLVERLEYRCDQRVSDELAAARGRPTQLIVRDAKRCGDLLDRFKECRRSLELCGAS